MGLLEGDSSLVKMLTQQLGLACSSVYSLMKNRHFSTDLLWKISLALNHNFFQHFDPTYGPSDPLTEAQRQVETLERQLADCRAELANTQQAEPQSDGGDEAIAIRLYCASNRITSA